MNLFLFLQAFCIIGYVPSVILFHYVVSFTFKSIQNTKEFWSFIFPTVSKQAEPNLFFPFIQISNFVSLFMYTSSRWNIHDFSFFLKIKSCVPLFGLGKHHVYLSIFSEFYLLQ